MFEKLIAVVSLEKELTTEKPTTAPTEPTPTPAPEEPRPESQAHIEWRRAKEQFIQQFCHGSEPTDGLAEIMMASIGPEPDFS